MIYLVILAAVVSTALGGLFAVKFKDKLHLILGFGAGAILGVALFDLLPESIKLTNGSYAIQTVMLLVGLGFASFLLLDRGFSIHGHDHKSCNKPSHGGKFAAAAIVLHSFLDGFSIGLAFKISAAVGWVVAVAVLIHGFSDGINTVNMVARSEKGKKSVLKWLAVDASAPAIGVFMAYLFTVSNPVLGLVMAFFVGIFIYISTSDLIPESHHRHPVIWTTIATIVGMLSIYIASNIAG